MIEWEVYKDERREEREWNLIRFPEEINGYLRDKMSRLLEDTKWIEAHHGNGDGPIMEWRDSEGFKAGYCCYIRVPNAQR